MDYKNLTDNQKNILILKNQVNTTQHKHFTLNQYRIENSRR